MEFRADERVADPPRNSESTAQTARVCCVIPTFNEAGNITGLLARLTALYPDPRFRFLIVDDESPDGTAALVRKAAAEDSRIELLTNPRRGLGRAYVRGMNHALDAVRADIVVEMDADFSHDPADLRRLLECIESGADVAIGSRYVKGGSIDERWHPVRRWLSRGGNWLASRIAGIRDVKDCTAGFRAIRADALRRAAPARIQVQGYVFQITLLHRLLQEGARVVEVPVHFRDRENGETKLDLKAITEFFWHVWWLRLDHHRIFVRFMITGASGVVVNLGSFQLLLLTGMHQLLASPIAIELSIVSNFLINNYWTFGGRNLAGRTRIRGLKFNLVSVLTLTLSYGTFALLFWLFPQAHPVLLQGFAILPGTLANYFLNIYWTFREHKP